MVRKRKIHHIDLSPTKKDKVKILTRWMTLKPTYSAHIAANRGMTMTIVRNYTINLYE